MRFQGVAPVVSRDARAQEAPHLVPGAAAGEAAENGQGQLTSQWTCAKALKTLDACQRRFTPRALILLLTYGRPRNSPIRLSGSIRSQNILKVARSGTASSVPVTPQR